jgi:hypothetical protein
MQVVVPSVSLAAVLQRTAATIFVETPSSATLLKPVADWEISGPPTSGAAPAVNGIAGGARAAGGDPLPIVPVVCCATAAPDIRVRNTATERVIIIPIGASFECSVPTPKIAPSPLSIQLISAPAPVQSHIHGTLTDVKDGTIGVELKGETVSIKLAGDAGPFLVTKANRHECDPDW